MASPKEENVQKEEIVQKEESTHEEKSTPEEDCPLIPKRIPGTSSPYTEEDIYYLTHPETWISQIPPLPERQNAVTLPNRKPDEVDTGEKLDAYYCSNLTEALARIP